MKWSVLERWLRAAPRAERAVGYFAARRAFRGCDVGPWVCVTGRIRVAKRSGYILIGRSALFLGGLEPTCLTAEDASIAIGEASVIDYGTHLSARHADIVLGRRCHVASRVRLLAEPGAPILVGDDVWIAHGAVIEGGVRIGSGSVVAAAAVVRSHVPADSLAIGHPARSLSLDLVPGGMRAAGSRAGAGVGGTVERRSARSPGGEIQ